MHLTQLSYSTVASFFSLPVSSLVDRTGQYDRMDACTTAGEVSRCARTSFSVYLGFHGVCLNMGMSGTFSGFVGILVREREKVLVRQSHGTGLRDGWFQDGDIFEYN